MLQLMIAQKRLRAYNGGYAGASTTDGSHTK
jgi:hypothetical protein